MSLLKRLRQFRKHFGVAAPKLSVKTHGKAGLGKLLDELGERGPAMVRGDSGYGNSHAAASHAWVDVWLNTHWVSVDVTNAIFASDSHCRLAIGRDYLDACPVRGVREGGLTEQLDVSVTVQTLQQ